MLKLECLNSKVGIIKREANVIISNSTGGERNASKQSYLYFISIVLR